MKKILILCTLMMLWTAQVFAFGHNTILGETVSAGNMTGNIPSVDGLNNLPLQKNINSILRSAAEGLAKEAGGKAVMSYEVTLNRPTLFSVVLKAVGTRTVYKGMNIDDTTGKEVIPKDLFYVNDAYNKIIGTREYVLSENGLLCAEGKSASYNNLIPYSALLKSINIAEGARLITSYKLTEAAESKTLRLKAGELVALYLAANPTTGYNWSIANGDSLTGFVSMGNSFFLPSNSNGMTGSPGTTIMFFSFDRPGSYTLNLNYERPWEHSPIQSKKYSFLVK